MSFHVAIFRLFKPVRSETLHDKSRKCLLNQFTNKEIDATDISNVLRHKEVTYKVLLYFLFILSPIITPNHCT